MPTPSLKFIKTFQVAARQNSFKLAAAELHVTASAISHQIKVLEEQLGLGLFERGANSLTLTEAGRSYLQSIDTLFARLDLVTDQLRERFHKLAVRLTVPPFFANELLLPKLSAFSEVHAEIDIHVNTRSAPNAEHAAESDVSIICGSGHWPNMVTRCLFPQRVVPACAPALLRDKRICAPSDLADEALIVDSRRLDQWERWAALQGVEALCPRQEIRIDSMSAAVHAAEQGLGIALVSAPVAVKRFESGRLKRVFDAELITGESYFLVARPEDAERPDISALIEWLALEFVVPASQSWGAAVPAAAAR
jgi:LysR family glycine cleavage system transcriptional activator